jgi:hypothetical protein
MKAMRTFILIASLLCSAVWLSAEPITAGTYKGKWEGASASGAISVTLTSSDGKWTGAASFGMGGEDVKCTVKSVKVDGSKMTMVYTFDLQGNALQSAIEGEMSGNKLSGKYKTTAADGSTIDEGTWTATQSGS